MKDKAMAYGLWFAVGFIAVGFGISRFFPILGDILADVVSSLTP